SISTTALSTVFLDSTIAPLQVLGASLVIGGLFITVWQQRKHELKKAASAAGEGGSGGDVSGGRSPGAEHVANGTNHRHARAGGPGIDREPLVSGPSTPAAAAAASRSVGPVTGVNASGASGVTGVDAAASPAATHATDRYVVIISPSPRPGDHA